VAIPIRRYRLCHGLSARAKLRLIDVFARSDAHRQNRFPPRQSDPRGNRSNKTNPISFSRSGSAVIAPLSDMKAFSSPTVVLLLANCHEILANVAIPFDTSQVLNHQNKNLDLSMAIIPY